MTPLIILAVAGLVGGGLLFTLALGAAAKRGDRIMAAYLRSRKSHP